MRALIDRIAYLSGSLWITLDHSGSRIFSVTRFTWRGTRGFSHHTMDPWLDTGIRSNRFRAATLRSPWRKNAAKSHLNIEIDRRTNRSRSRRSDNGETRERKRCSIGTGLFRDVSAGSQLSPCMFTDTKFTGTGTVVYIRCVDWKSRESSRCPGQERRNAFRSRRDSGPASIRRNPIRDASVPVQRRRDGLRYGKS